MAPFDGRPPKRLVLGGGGLRRDGVDDRVLAGYEDATGRDALRGAALLEAVAPRSRGAVVKTVTPDDAAVLWRGLIDPDRGGRVLAADCQ